jgi:hypothetical protein
MLRASIEVQGAGSSRRIADIVVANVGGDDRFADYAWSAIERESPAGSPGLSASGVLRSHDRRKPAMALVSSILSAALGGSRPEPDEVTPRFLQNSHRLLDAPPPPEGSPASMIRAILEVTEAARREDEARHPIAAEAKRATGLLTNLVLEDGRLDGATAIALVGLIETALGRVADADFQGGQPISVEALKKATAVLTADHRVSG